MNLTWSRRPAVLAAGAMMLGIFSQRALPHQIYLYLAFAAVFTVAGLIFLRDAGSSTASLCVAIFVVGVSLAQLESFQFARDDIAGYVSEEARIGWLRLRVDQPP